MEKSIQKKTTGTTFPLYKKRTGTAFPFDSNSAVRPSVHNIPVSDENGLTYRQVLSASLYFSKRGAY